MSFKINFRDVLEDELRSPAGKYHSFCRNLSLALGGVRNAGTWGGGHPFDLQIRRIPAGASVCPFHSHLAQWEFFVVRSGTGTVRVGDARHPIRPGDVFIHPPGEAHQLTNSGTTDLEVLIVTDNPVLDACFYPDSNKWGLRPPMKVFRMAEADYFDGEEPPAPVSPTAYQPKPSPPPPPPAPFTSRKVNLDDLKWENWTSPKGRFAQSGKELSIALGAKHRQPLTQGGHPFDVEFGKIPPGKTSYPFHFHALQWECYFFQSGSGEFRLDGERFPVGPGDLVMAKPGAAHTFSNTGTDDLLYLIVTDDPPADYWHYPDSGKWGFSTPRKLFRMTEVDYHDGEE